jgi:hypothetical protein
MWTSPPQTGLLRLRTQREPFEQTRIVAAPTAVEVRSRRADTNKLDVHVQAVPRSEDVAEKPSVIIDPVGRRLGH